MKNTKRRILSLFLAVLMVVTMLPITASAAETTENNNQYDGIVLRKHAVPHLDDSDEPDGTVDIIVEAFTTGKVTSLSYAEPTDIVLVLDVSGSMDDNYTVATSYSYTEANGTKYQTGFGYNRTTY